MIQFKFKALKLMYSAMMKIIAGKSTIPILDGFLFSLYKNGYSVTVTNLDEFMVYRDGDCRGECTKTFVLRKEDFKGIVDSMESTMSLEMVQDNNLLKVSYVSDSGSRINTSVPWLSALEFPLTPEIKLQGSLKTAQFFDIYKKALVAVSIDKTREALCGVYFDVENKCAVATDGRVLKVQDYKELPLAQNLLLPVTKTLTQANIFAETMKFGSKENQFVIDDGTWQYTVKVPECLYPNYRQVIPDIRQYSTKLTLEKDILKKLPLLAQRLKAGDTDSAISLVLHESGLYVAVHNNGTWQTVLIKSDGSRYTDKLRYIHVNHELLSKITKDLDDCSIYLMDSTSPIIFKDENSISVIMPMRSSTDEEGLLKCIEELPVAKVPTQVKAVDEKPPVEPEPVQEPVFEPEPEPVAETPVSMPKVQAPVSMPKPELTVVGNVSLITELYQLLDELDEMHNLAKDKVASADKAVRDCQLAAKVVKRQLKLYEKEVAGKFKEANQAKDILSKFKNLVA